MRLALNELDQDAHATLARLRDAGPVTWVGALDGWLVTGYDTAVEVMRASSTFTVDDPRFSTARVVGRSMLSTDGTEHTRHRSPFVAPFRPAKVQERFGDDVERLAHDLVSRFTGHEEVELRGAVAGPLSVAVVAEILGLGASDAATMLGWYDVIVAATTASTTDSAVPQAARTAMASLASEVRGGLGGGSLLDEAGRSLSDEEVVSNAAVMMFGGIETTEGMILNVVRHVLVHGIDLGRVVDDATYAAGCVEESLRMEPAAAVVDRYAATDVVVDDVEIARGDLVRVSLAGANRDPGVFVEPDRFDPMRSNLRAQLSFARGPHVCVAMDLARLEARVALQVLTRRLPDLRLVAPAEPRGLIFRKPPELRVSWSCPSQVREPGHAPTSGG